MTLTAYLGSTFLNLCFSLQLLLFPVSCSSFSLWEGTIIIINTLIKRCNVLFFASLLYIEIKKHLICCKAYTVHPDMKTKTYKRGFHNVTLTFAHMMHREKCLFYVSFRSAVTYLPSLSGDGYEEHSMDATDTQHYKEVTYYFFK